jgi:hypothetical protein
MSCAIAAIAAAIAGVMLGAARHGHPQALRQRVRPRRPATAPPARRLAEEDAMKTKREIQAEYAPHDRFAEFHIGWQDYLDRHLRNPYGAEGVAAQSWDRGAEAAMKWERAGRPA